MPLRRILWSHMKPGHRLVLASLITLTMFAGCGSSDDPPAADSNSVTEDSTPPSDSSADTVAGSGGSDAPATTRAPSSGGLGMGAETWAKQLKVALRADDYSIEGNTVTLVLGSGTTADSESDCGVAGATAGTNVTVVVSYPDGEVAC